MNKEEFREKSLRSAKFSYYDIQQMINLYKSDENGFEKFEKEFKALAGIRGTFAMLNEEQKSFLMEQIEREEGM